MKSPCEQTRIVDLVIVTGIASVVSQLLIIREFLSRFQGNEFVIALILFCWLVLSGAGTWAARASGFRLLNPGILKLSVLSMLLAALSPLTLLGVRMLRDVVFLAGSDTGFYATFLFILATAAPYCILLGFLLPYSLFCARTLEPEFSGTKIYIADNIGDVSGGAIFSFALIFVATPLQSLLGVNLILLAAAFLLAPPKHRCSFKVLVPALISACVLAGAFLMEARSLNRPDGHLVHYEESRYGRIEIYKKHDQHTLFLDGRPIFSDENIIHAEEIIHYPLSQIKSVDNLLLISAEGGMMGEIKKYEPICVNYVEIDPAMTKALLSFEMIQKIKGLQFIHQDAGKYLSNAQTTYDAVIMDMPEPETFQTNRFYTDTFFNKVCRRLKSDGVFCFHVRSPGNYVSAIQQQKISVLYKTASLHFSEILMIPGSRLYFVCANKKLDAGIPGKLASLGIKTDYIQNYFAGEITPDRLEHLNAQVLDNAAANTDFHPRLVRILFSQWFAEFHTSPGLFFIVFFIAAAVYLIRCKSEERVLFTTGAMAMGCEVLVIFAFQVFFGYIYFEIGLIVTVFLAGLLPGAVIGERLKHRGRMLFVITDSVLIFSLIGFTAILYFAGSFVWESIFLMFGAVVSVACGLQFPVALHLGGHGNPAAVRAFSADLMGAAAGTLAASVVLMPYTGLLGTAAGLTMLKTASLVFVLFAYD